MLLSMWVHACFYCVICKESWVLINFGDIYVPACHYICGYTLTIPPSHSLPYYPQTLHSPCPLSQTTTLGGGLPPLDHGSTAATRAAVPTLFVFVVFVLATTYTMLPQDLTSILAPSEHPCMKPHFTPISSLYPIAISVLAINSLSQARYWASSRQTLRIERPPTTT